MLKVIVLECMFLIKVVLKDFCLLVMWMLWMLLFLLDFWVEDLVMVSFFSMVLFMDIVLFVIRLW